MTRPCNDKVVLERRYRAGIEEVWALWTTKDGFESWWGPVGFRVAVHALEPRAGGRLHYDMIAATPETVAAMQNMGQAPSHPVHATFTRVEHPSHLAITNVIDFLPGVPAYESVIEVAFAVVGDGVRMTTTLYPLHSAEFTRMSAAGYTSQLTKLDGRFD